MAILKPGQLSPGPYNISGSFSGSFSGNGSNLVNLPIETGSFVTTSSFNAFTGSYNTGSFTGSFIGNGSGLTGIVSASYALTASYAVSASYEINYETSSSYAETASVAISASYAATASYVQNAQTASYILNAASSSFSTIASFATNALSASFASTVPASGVIGLNLTQIATSSFSASVSPTQFTITSASITELKVTGTGVTIGSAPTDTHRVTGSLTTLGTSSFTNPTQLSGNQTTSPLITLNQSLVSFGNSSVMFRASETSVNNSFAVELYKRSGNSETRFLAGGNGTGTNTERSFMTVIGTNTAGDGSVTFDRSVGIGSTPSSSIRLDVRAQGVLSTDTVFRVRNSADSANIFTANGDGTQNWFIPANNALNSIKSSTFNVIQYGNDAFGNIALGYNSSNMIVPTTTYNTVLGASASSGASSTFAIGIGWGSIVNSTAGIVIGRTRVNGNYAIRIGYDGGASQYGGTNSIHLGRTTSGNDIAADNVFMTYFDSQSPSVVIRSSGSLGLLGQQAYIITNGTGALGTDTHMGNGGNTLVVRNHPSVPSTNVTDSFQQYSADIIAGNAAPHFRTENGSIIKLYQQAAVTSSQGLANVLTNLGLLTGSSVIPSGGPFGIANTSGSYTYYTTFSASMAAATSGQTVEMFADIIETTNISIALKDGVNINGNGHTYTLNQAGTANCIQDGGIAVNCSISNITFKRLGGTPSSTVDSTALSFGMLYSINSVTNLAYLNLLLGSSASSFITLAKLSICPSKRESIASLTFTLDLFVLPFGLP